jgi:dipeptidase E
VKLLLTSAGIKNATIEAALVELLGKPIADCDALCIPTASYGHNSFAGARRFVAGENPNCPMVELGWKSVGLLEVAALATLEREHWVAAVEAADVLLANGGDALYLSHHMRESGLAELLPALDTVWAGFSAGSMVMTPRIGDDFKVWEPSGGGDTALGFVDFAIFPHLDCPVLPENTMAHAERWFAGLDVPAYAIDDDTALVWVDGEIEVVSGTGHWRYFS